MAVTEYRNVGSTRVALDDGGSVDPGFFTVIENSGTLVSAAVAAGNLRSVVPGTFALIYGHTRAPGESNIEAVPVYGGGGGGGSPSGAAGGILSGTYPNPDPNLPTLNEYVRDAIGSALVAGSNVSINVDDAGDTITVSATAGGGGLDFGSEVFNIKSYGAVGDGVTNDTSALGAALTAAKARTNSTGKCVAVFIPSGNFRIIGGNGADILTWQSKISLIGAGRSVARLAVESVSGATGTCNFIKGLFGSPGGAGVDMHFRGFELDMDNVFAGAAYTPTQGKGFYMQYCKRSSWSDLYVHGTKATGIGVDFLVDCHVQNNLVENCGNFVAAQGTGDSGIGIGSGRSPDEYCVITGNVVTGSRNYGIFTEKQGGGASVTPRGLIIGNNLVRGNRIGISDTGAQGTLIAGNEVNDNTSAGISVSLSAIGSGPNDGRETLVVNNVVMRNGGGGIGAKSAVYVGRVTISGNRIAYNSGDGIGADFSTTSVPQTSALNPVKSLAVVDNDIHHNGGYGINAGPATNSGYAQDFIVERNRVYNNNSTGFRIKATITRLRVVGNIFWDDQTARSVTDGATDTTTTVTSATAAFTAVDVGKKITGAGIPAGTIIDVVNSGTSATLTNATTATASGVTFVIGQAATQTTGFSVITGSVITDGVIKDNDARGCATPYAVNLASLGGNLVMESNPGLTGGGPTTVTVTASPFTYTAGRSPEDVYIDGGTVSDIKKGSTSVYSNTGRLVRLGAGETTTVTYSVAPTMVADKR